MTEFGLALNVHLKTSAIVSKSYNELVNLVCDILNLPEQGLERVNNRQLMQVNKILRHLKVFTKHGNRMVTYTIDRIVEKYPRDAYFQHKEKGKTSIHDYFKMEYQIRLKQLPMVHVTGKDNVHLPLELCYLQESQFLNKTKFDMNIQRELLFKSTHQPNVYFHKVATIVNRINEADSKSGGILKKFGMDLNSKAARFEGRVLPTPRNLNSTNRDRFYKVAPKLPEWVVFCFDNNFNEKQLENFSRQMSAKAFELGLTLDKPSTLRCIEIKSFEDIRNVFHNVHKKTNADLVFVAIPSRMSRFCYF